VDHLKPDEFLMDVADFKEAFPVYTVTYLHDEWHNSFIEKRNAVNRKNYRFNFTISEDDLADAADAEPVSPKKAAEKEGAAPAKKGAKAAEKKAAPAEKEAAPAPSAKVELDDSEPDSPNDAEADQ
jgi:hypothetical protein